MGFVNLIADELEINDTSQMFKNYNLSKRELSEYRKVNRKIGKKKKNVATAH